MSAALELSGELHSLGVELEQRVQLPGREVHAVKPAPGLDVDKGQWVQAEARPAVGGEGREGFPQRLSSGRDLAEQQRVGLARCSGRALQVDAEAGAVGLPTGQLGFALRRLDQLVAERLIKRSRSSRATLTWSRSHRSSGSR